MAVDDNDFVVLDEDDVGDYNPEGILPQSSETIQKIEAWLQPTEFDADYGEYKKHLSAYVIGTGNWIQETETYQTWHDSPGSASLWIKAIPGAGKSVFAAMIADRLARTEKEPVLYFFFRQIVVKNHDPKYLVRDWLCQLLPYSPSLQSELKRHVENNQSLDDISTDEFWHILLHAMQSIPKIYCIVDALDEMDISNTSFLNHLVELGEKKHSIMKMLMTSRPLPRIESVLRSPSVLQISILQIRLRKNMVDTDIAVYVDHRLRQQADVKLTHEVRDTIRNAICSKGQGSFLYARLMMDSLFEDITTIIANAMDIDLLMRRLPASLEDMYNGVLLDHATRSGVSQELQYVILQWVTHSIRPLRLLELATMIDSLDGTQRRSKDTKALVRTACGPLLEILEDETVSIIHHSLTEFLLDQGREQHVLEKNRTRQFPVIKSTDTHRLLAQTCLGYLNSGILNGQKLPSTLLLHNDNSIYRDRQKDPKMDYPFLDYAASNVFTHVSRMDPADEKLFAALDEFMRIENPAFTSWHKLARPRLRVSDVSPLHVAAHDGVLNYCQHLIKLGHDINGLDGDLRTPISWASTKGHANIVACLLENGANADLYGKEGLNPLHYAAMTNQFLVVRLLLATGVDPLTPRFMNYPRVRCGNSTYIVAKTPLNYACQGGCAEAAIEFVKYLSAEELDRALGCAARAGKTNVVIALLESPHISVDNLACGATPLYSAAHVQNPMMIRALLQKGANPNGRSGTLRARRPPRFRGHPFQEYEILKETPLHSVAGGARHVAASTLDNEDVLRECCKLLVDAGGDVDAIGADGRYPIHYSTSPAITSVLLEHGAKATVTSNNGSTPLHLACENNAHEKLIELLVHHGADINAKRHMDGKSPLHLMFKASNPRDIEWILRYKPDVNAKDDDGNTPLHLAVRQSNDGRASNSVQILLDAGADPRQTNLKMESPIHLVGRVRMSRVMEIIPILLNGGADLEARDSFGRTVLLGCLNDPKDVRQLLGLGANVGARDFQGNSVLHLICQGHRAFSLDLLRLLVDAGANLTWLNHEGNTVLHEASKATASTSHLLQVQFLSELVQLGVPVSQKNYSGRTPLHIACSSWSGPGLAQSWKAVIEFLLQPVFRIKIDEGDNNGIRAIHLAATISEQLVFWLVNAGADPSVRTFEGQTPLQIACRARQTNIVGMLLELYAKRGESHMIDWKDTRGRTALHDACRSGRPETVKLLLQVGADPNMKDKIQYSPLHVCVEFIEENAIWSLRRPFHDSAARVTAANVLIGDSNRPVQKIPHRPHQKPHSIWDSEIGSEHDTVRIRETLKLLLSHGADVDDINPPDCTPLYIAVCAGCEVMVDELLSATQKAVDESKIPLHHGSALGDAFARQYSTLRSQHGPRLIGSMLKEGKESFDWNKLLRLDDDRLFQEPIRRRADFFNRDTKQEAFPATLAAWGYASLLGNFGREVSMYHDPSRIKDFVNSSGLQFQPLLHKACERQLPNMDVIRILIDKFGVDVNARAITKTGSGQNETALHILASGTYCWHTQAIEFILRRGADTEMENEKGQSPLSMCVESKIYGAGCWRNAVADILLRHGANPNSIDSEGLTCLNKAGSDAEIVRNLIKYGADVNLGDTPALFTAIDSHDLATIGVILDSGAGLASRRKAEFKQEGIPVSEIPPLHYAAWNTENVKSRRASALPVVRLFLEKGADPFEIMNGETTVIHDILANRGIIEPFLELPGLQIESRDPQGRTLLLASCSSSFPKAGHFSFFDPADDEGPHVASILYKMGADIKACDNNGLNSLHYLLLASHRENKSYQATFFDFVKDAPVLVHQREHRGNTPLHYALQRRCFWALEYLISAGSSPTEPDSDGNTALHHLTRTVNFNLENYKGEQLLLFKKFLALGVSINAQNKLGETPLFIYAASDLDRSTWADGIREDVALFQNAGADFFARNYNMETVLHIIAKNRSNICVPATPPIRRRAVDLFNYLMELGCDPLAEDSNQRTSLDVAAACGNEDILKLFQRDG